MSPHRRPLEQAPHEGPGKPRPIRVVEELEGDRRTSQSERRGAVEAVIMENPT